MLVLVMDARNDATVYDLMLATICDVVTCLFITHIYYRVELLVRREIMNMPLIMNKRMDEWEDSKVINQER